MPKGKRARRHWLFKTEPETYGIDDLERDRVTGWEGVRNHQARNLLRDEVGLGDGVLIYHSSCDPLAVTGVAEVVRSAYPDDTAFDVRSPYHDPRSDPAEPTWLSVDVGFVGRFREPVLRSTLSAMPELAGMMLLKRGSRLSIQPVSPAEWTAILKVAGFREAR
ncbi:MAG: EVE domain-containing protein [Planctomycetota bacterium]